MSYSSSGTTNQVERTRVDRIEVQPNDARTMMRNHVSWGAIIAGVVIALVTQLLLNLLGIGIGLTTLDPYNAGNNPSASGASLTTAGWIAITGLIASFLGGAVAGRLCGTSRDRTGAMHGLVTWGAATLVLFFLLSTAVGNLAGGAFSAVGSVARGIGGAVGGAGQAIAQAVPGAAQALDPAGTLTQDLKNQVQGAVNSSDPQAVQDSIINYVRTSATGDAAAQERAKTRAIETLARAANVSPDEARTRLDQLQTQYNDARAKAEQVARDAAQKAKEAADATRKAAATGAIAGFVALALGALAAWFGGGYGAPRREMNISSTSSTI